MFCYYWDGLCCGLILRGKSLREKVLRQKSAHAGFPIQHSPRRFGGMSISFFFGGRGYFGAA